MMILETLSPAFARDMAHLRTFAQKPSLWQKQAEGYAKAYQQTLTTDAAIGLIQKARRLIRIFIAGLENDVTFKHSLESAHLTNWEDFTEPPCPRALQDSLCDKLYIVEKNTDVPTLDIGDQARYIGAQLFERCAREKLSFDVHVHDENFSALLITTSSDAGLSALAQYFLDCRTNVTTRIFVQHNLPVWPSVKSDTDKQRAYKKLMAPWRARVLSGSMRSVLTSIPTTRDAEIDGIDYAQYTELYFRMCDQPWDAIHKAQAHLIKTLNTGKNLHFTNSDGTDLTMNIDGFTFCNSVIARNIPGSEVFSAPHIDSTNGVIVAKGRFSAREEAGAIIEDITLRFENGLLIEATAAKGQEHLDKALSVDDGTRRIGEIGIGTNPYLKQHVASILLSEKIGGSFHVALGDAYTMTDYMGDPVNVDNGNRSQLHWDITTMLIGKQGKIILDGAPVMVDGLFVDPALDVLNRGWQAIPYDQRPQEWQKIYPDTPVRTDGLRHQ